MCFSRILMLKVFLKSHLNFRVILGNACKNTLCISVGSLCFFLHSVVQNSCTKCIYTNIGRILSSLVKRILVKNFTLHLHYNSQYLLWQDCKRTRPDYNSHAFYLACRQLIFIHGRLVDTSPWENPSCNE